MGHYDEQYEEMYERQRVAKESNLKTKKEKLVEKGYTLKEINTFIDMAKILLPYNTTEYL